MLRRLGSQPLLYPGLLPAAHSALALPPALQAEGLVAPNWSAVLKAVKAVRVLPHRPVVRP